MSQKEINRLSVIQKLAPRRLTQVKASELLGLSSRQVRRLQARYRAQGPSSLISKQRGTRSDNRLPPELKQTVLALLKTHYYDFGPTLAR